MVQDLFIIGDRLAELLQRLSAELKVPFSTIEINRVFKDAEADQVSKKLYCFYDSKIVRITGEVDEYEPDTIRIQVQGRAKEERAFRRFIDDIRLLLGPNKSIQ